MDSKSNLIGKNKYIDFLILFNNLWSNCTIHIYKEIHECLIISFERIYSYEKIKWTYSYNTLSREFVVFKASWLYHHMTCQNTLSLLWSLQQWLPNSKDQVISFSEQSTSLIFSIIHLASQYITNKCMICQRTRKIFDYFLLHQITIVLRFYGDDLYLLIIISHEEKDIYVGFVFKTSARTYKTTAS